MTRKDGSKWFRIFAVCAFNRHVPNDKHAWWDGLNYVSECAKCGAKIRRVKRGDWRRDWLHEATPNNGAS
jgi:hypothetical protein